MKSYEELKIVIKKILEIKEPRYILKGWIDKNYPNLYNEIFESTNFLVEEAKLQERIFCILNDIQSAQVCCTCNKSIHDWHKFNITKDEYLNQFCSASCMRSFKVDLSIKPSDNYFNLVEIKSVVNFESDVMIKRNRNIIDQMKNYFNSLGIDYSKMQFIEMINFIKWGLVDIPKCKNEVCNNRVKYHNGHYEDFCSKVCHLTSSRTKEKRVETVKDRYGVDNVFQSNIIKDKIKDTCIERFGAESYRKSQAYKDYRKVTPLIQDNAHKAAMRWLTTYKGLERFKDKVIPNFSELEFKGIGYDKIYSWKCVKCNTIFTAWYNNGLIPQCTNCNKGTKIEGYLSKFLSNSLGLSIQTRCRSILDGGRELDIYIPEKNVAIEVDGMYWHSEKNGGTKEYHLGKTNECLEKGIRLVHIFEDEFTYNRGMVLSKLREVLGKSLRVIDISMCSVREVKDEVFIKKYMDKYSLNGFVQGIDICLGLYYKDRVVGMLSCCRVEGETGWEVVNFGCMNRFESSNIFSRLLSEFEKVVRVKFLLLFADKRWESVEDYFSMGFKFSHEEEPEFWVIEDYHGKREYPQVYKESWEELELNGYDRIWDCGCHVFVKEYK
jgi:hypothetical protein